MEPEQSPEASPIFYQTGKKSRSFVGEIGCTASYEGKITYEGNKLFVGGEFVKEM